MTGIKTWCTEATNFAVDICDKVIGTSTELSAYLNRIGDVLSSQRLTIPEEAPRDVRVRVDQARAAMAQAQDRLARATAMLKAERKKIADFATKCVIVDALRLSGTILALRRDAVAALQDLLLQARAIAAALAEIPEAGLDRFGFRALGRSERACRCTQGARRAHRGGADLRQGCDLHQKDGRWIAPERSRDDLEIGHTAQGQRVALPH